MSVGVNIFAHLHPEGFKKAIAEFKKLETAGAKAQFAVKKAAIPAAAALAGLTVAAKHALHAAMENETSQMRFAKVIENVTGATEGQIEALEKSIEAMAKQTGISKEQLRPAMQYLVVATGSVATAQKDLALAMDISAATGADLESVTAALGKAHNGVTKGLVKLDPSLKKVLGTTKDFTVIQDLLTQKFGGAEAAFEKTAAGGMRRFQESIHEMWESMGNALLPVFKAVIPYLQAFGEWAQKHSKMFVIMAAGVAAFASAILVANTVLKVMAIWEAVVNAANPFALIALAVIAVIAVVTALYMKFEIVRTVINAVINAIIGAFEVMTNDIIHATNFIIDGINLLIKAANLFGAGLPEIAHIGEVSFGRIGQAVKATEKNLADFRRGEHEAGAEAVKTGEDTKKAFGGAGKTIETAAEKVKKYIDALKSETDAEKSAAEAGRAVTKAQTDQMVAHEKVATALAKFNLIAKGYGEASKEAAAQSRAVAQAQRDLTQANNGVTDATKALADAEAKLNALRQKPSATTIGNAETDLEKAKLNAEKATFDVLDAEQALADLRTQGDATPEEIRKQEISLQEAKFAQRDATLAVTEAEAALKKLREDSPTAEEIASAERDVADAKLAVEQAISDQEDATKKLNDENLLYSQIVSGAAEDSDIYKEALKELTDARKDEANAIDAVRDAKDRELEATLKLAEAELALQDVKTKAGGKIVARGNKTLADAIAAAQARIAEAHGIPAMANGGIVTQPTLALIGEKGSEAVIPLSQMGGMGGNTYITVNAGMGVDGAEVGKQIIDAIKKAERRSGKVFASA